MFKNDKAVANSDQAPIGKRSKSLGDDTEKWMSMQAKVEYAKLN
jgi:hypothetical protein